MTTEFNLSRFVNDVAASARQQEPELNQAATAGMLMEAYNRFTAEPVRFEPGQLVVYKTGLAMTDRPGPFIVIEINYECKPIRDKNGISLDGYCFGDPYQPDILIGYLDSENDLTLTYSESRRLELYTGPTPETI